MQRPSDPDAPSRQDYAAIMEDFDTEIGKLLDALAARGLDQRTLVVFVSDNGGEWLSRNDPFFSRKDTVWEGGIRVPALWRWPGVLPAGVTSSQVGITIDLAATFLVAAGVGPRPEWRSRVATSYHSCLVVRRPRRARCSGAWCVPTRARRLCVTGH